MKIRVKTVLSKKKKKITCVHFFTNFSKVCLVNNWWIIYELTDSAGVNRWKSGTFFDNWFVKKKIDTVKAKKLDQAALKKFNENMTVSFSFA